MIYLHNEILYSRKNKAAYNNMYEFCIYNTENKEKVK